MRPLRIWDRKRSQHAVAEGSMTRNLVQRAGDVLGACHLSCALPVPAVKLLSMACVLSSDSAEVVPS